MAQPLKNNPKYNFGLLVTPGSTDTSSVTTDSVNVESDSTSFSEQASERSLSYPTDYSRLTSGGSSTSRARYNTGLFTSGSASTSSAPAGFRTPRTNSGSSKRRTSDTGGSATPGAATPAQNNCSTLVAIVEGRGLAKGEVGMATLDLKKPELSLSQFSDMPTYVKTITKLQIAQPLEIIFPNTACESGTMTNLSKIVTEQFPNTTISTVQRKYFNETKGLMNVKHLCVPEYSSVELEIASKYYCLAAAAALIKYIEFIQNTVYAPASLKVVFKGSENTTMIDMSTARNLELLQNQRDPRSSHTLYGILNYTKTVGGARLLRSNILQPPSDPETISLRQDVVAELIEKSEVFYNLQAVISKFLDIDHLLSLCVQVPKQENVKTAETKITNMMYLKHTLELVGPLRDALGDCENPLLKATYKLLDDPRFVLMLSKINCIIHEDARYQKGLLVMRSQKCFAVKPKINGLLDMARKTYTEIVDDITDLVQQMAATYSLPLKVFYSSSRGFHAQMHCGPSDSYTTDNLPAIFIKVTKFKNTLSFTTTDLIKLNDRVKESLYEIYIMTSITARDHRYTGYQPGSAPDTGENICGTPSTKQHLCI
ncbi:hypothetical protein DPMN_036623 [Dreissena polymorpha]|uniref:DNA mismatch repair protein MutS core domain-containing protein n=1 Tax=Dreissena polymorpha TaxID=45954 RepID=A0A9D4RNA3_DREPO|nr:hypothetical protein DPMN_036623 [Dreissena polymorpha]